MEIIKALNNCLMIDFHEAARNGFIEILLQGSKRELNYPDQDGMTPVHWAAFTGQFEALRQIIIRGGNPRKIDTYGSNALHFAAMNGHLRCVCFLVSFDVNVFSLNNDYNCALDLASVKNHKDVVDYLENVIASYSLEKFLRLKEKAHKSVERRLRRSKNKSLGVKIKNILDKFCPTHSTNTFLNSTCKSLANSSNKLNTNSTYFSSCSNVLIKNSSPNYVPSSESCYDEIGSRINLNNRRNINFKIPSKNLFHSIDASSVNSSDNSESVKEKRRENFSRATNELYDFLKTLNLCEYMSLFASEKIDMKTLNMCTDDDLAKLCIPLGHRKIITSAIECMRMTRL